jgi:hypothetical protein
MPDPWDRPPIAPRGDDHEDISYAAIGRLTSQWESIESELSHLYAIFIGQYFKHEAYDEYFEKTRNFNMRLKAIEESGAKFFLNQKTEIEFHALITKIRGFSERRHEVAHGIVRPYYVYAMLTEWSDPFDQDRTRTCVVPPHYQRNWHDEKTKIPIYVYTSIQIDRISDLMNDLLLELVQFKSRFLPKPPASS